MFIGYTIKRDETVDNLLQETLRRCSECSIDQRPGRFPGLKNSSDAPEARTHECIRVDFKFYSDAAVMYTMSELYLKWKAVILQINEVNNGDPAGIAGLGTPLVVGRIHEQDVDAWELSKVYPETLRWIPDPKEGGVLLQLHLMGYIDEVGISSASPLEQLYDLERSGVLTQ